MPACAAVASASGGVGGVVIEDRLLEPRYLGAFVGRCPLILPSCIHAVRQGSMRGTPAHLACAGGDEHLLSAKGLRVAAPAGGLSVIPVLNFDDRDPMELESRAEPTSGDRLGIGGKRVHARGEYRPLAGCDCCLKGLVERDDKGGSGDAKEYISTLEGQVHGPGGDLSSSRRVPRAQRSAERFPDDASAAELNGQDDPQVAISTYL